MKVAAIGRTEILYDSIIKLKDAGHEIVMIITCEESPGYSMTALKFQDIAKMLGCEFICTEEINSFEVIEAIARLKPEIAISVNWKTAIKQMVISCFPHGIVNAHAGDLPRYRGNAVPNWAILNGENKIVLTLHLMVPEIDAGPILKKLEFLLNDNTYIFQVYDFMKINFPIMFLEVVNDFEHGSVKSITQPSNPALALRCYPRTPRDGEIDWRKTSREICTLIRASAEPFAGAYSYMGMEKVFIWRAKEEKSSCPFSGVPGQVAERRKNGDVVVIAADGFVVLQEIETIRSGRRKATEIIKTIRTRLGMDICGELARQAENIEKILKIINLQT